MTSPPYVKINESSLGDADNFMLADLSYLDLSGSYDPQQDRTLSEHVRILTEKDMLDQKVMFGDNSLVTLAAGARRFGSLVLRNYEEHTCQFGSVEIVLSEFCSYLSFLHRRLEEDFMIFFTRTRAQRDTFA